MTTTDRLAQITRPHLEAEPGSRLCLPLRDVLARIDTADAHRAMTLRLQAADGGQSIELPLRGRAGSNLRQLLACAATNHFDTVRITRCPNGPAVGVCRRRRRSRR